MDDGIKECLEPNLDDDDIVELSDRVAVQSLPSKFSSTFATRLEAFSS